MTEYHSIQWWQLVLAVGFTGIAGLASLRYQLGLGRDLFWGVLRTFGQLFAMGYLLTVLFGIANGLLVILVYAGMCFFSVHIIHGRVREKDVSYFAPTTISVMISYTLVSMLVTGVVIGVEPWWKPQFFIPIGGMVAGNSMNALALAVERFFSELRNRRDEVEMMLCHGADFREASQEMFRNALKAGMIPSINSLMGVGIVYLPGMMTGQILAGVDPVEAVRYQIVVMLMIVASTALSAIWVLHYIRRRCFGPAMNLVLRTETLP